MRTGGYCFWSLWAPRLDPWLSDHSLGSPTCTSPHSPTDIWPWLLTWAPSLQLRHATQRLPPSYPAITSAWRPYAKKSLTPSFTVLSHWHTFTFSWTSKLEVVELLMIWPKKNENMSTQRVFFFLQICIAALVIIGKRREQSKCPSTGEGIKKKIVGYLCNRILLSNKRYNYCDTQQTDECQNDVRHKMMWARHKRI